jgi:hypothetical protein
LRRPSNIDEIIFVIPRNQPDIISAGNSELDHIGNHQLDLSFAPLGSRLPECGGIDGQATGNGWRSIHMLAEKFILLLEALRSRTHPDGSPIVVSTSRHVPIKLPGGDDK